MKGMIIKMNKKFRRAVIAGNWKMNNTPSETVDTIKKIADLTSGKNDCDIVLCVPFVDIQAAVSAAKGTNIKIGDKMYILKKRVRIREKYQQKC